MIPFKVGDCVKWRGLIGEVIQAGQGRVWVQFSDGSDAVVSEAVLRDAQREITGRKPRAAVSS